mmetsp:Transcript_2705/g.6499  ORF Transcript_2705/g.6499 Transcript_2705/m.6499 type:complete len:380 (+) Transcript_2705:110-1249(+)
MVHVLHLSRERQARCLALCLVTVFVARREGRSFAAPVSLLVAFSADRDVAAVSLEGEFGCPSTPELLLKDLDLWMRMNSSTTSSRVAGKPAAHRTLGYGHVRSRLNGYWQRGRLLVSCYDALAWLRTGKRSETGPPSADDVRRDVQRVLEREGEATDKELRQWISQEYGEKGLDRLLAAAKDSDNNSLIELKDFFIYFRDHFPYYRGACHSCHNASEFLGLTRPSEQECREGGAGVSEIYFCRGCEMTTDFPRFRKVRPVLISHRGRCGEYSWTAVRFLEALGFPARWVDNHAGHVWAEAFVAGRWVHIDPCEAAVDEPLLYANGWGRCPTHVLAYEVKDSIVSIEDVTSSYRPPKAEAIGEETSKMVSEAVAKALSKP